MSCLPAQSPVKNGSLQDTIHLIAPSLAKIDRRTTNGNACFLSLTLGRMGELAQLRMVALCLSKARWDESHQWVCFDLSCCNCFRKGNLSRCKRSRALNSGVSYVPTTQQAFGRKAGISLVFCLQLRHSKKKKKNGKENSCFIIIVICFFEFPAFS